MPDQKIIKALVNERFEFSETQLSTPVDWVPDGKNRYHLLHNNKSYVIEVLGADHEKKLVDLRINGNPYQVQLKNKLDNLVDQMGLSVASDQKINDIKAPMPGLVLDLQVKVGQTVVKGDNLLILEAMKMENVIKSQGEGVIKAIHVEKGVPVDKGQLLVELE